MGECAPGLDERGNQGKQHREPEHREEDAGKQPSASAAHPNTMTAKHSSTNATMARPAS
jgi:hypothetical protein